MRKTWNFFFMKLTWECLRICLKSSGGFYIIIIFPDYKSNTWLLLKNSNFAEVCKVEDKSLL